MKVFIDTNILVSAALFPGSIPHQAFDKAVTEPNEAMICDQNIDEIKRIFNKKFVNKLDILNSFLALIMTSVTIVRVPEMIVDDEEKIRDVKDRPIFRAAIRNGADIFLTGDKDFLESGIQDPRIQTPADFVRSKQ